MSIGKVGKSKISGGVVDYIFKKQKADEKQPKIIGGNITGETKKEIKAEFRDQEKLNPNVKNTITHFSISFPPGKTVSDEDAADFADKLMKKLDYDKNPYIVVRHFDKEKRDDKPFGHIHIGASRIKNDGTLIPEWQIAEKVIEAVKEIDKQFDLESVEYVRLSAEEKSERSVKKDEYQMMAQKGKLSVLEEFKDCADVSLNEKKNVQKFVRDVQTGGFEVAPNISETTGKMNGFAFSKDGIVFTAKKAGNKFKWANLSPEIDYQPERDAKFLHELKAEFTAKKEAEKEAKKNREKQLAEQPAKQPEEAVKAAEKAAKKTKKQIIEVVENETTRERETTRHSAGNGASAENGQAIGEKSDSQTKDAAVEKPAREKSGSRLAQAQIAGAQSSQTRDDRTDDQAARSGQKITGHDAEDFSPIGRNEEGNTIVDERGGLAVEQSQIRSEQSVYVHRAVSIGANNYPTGKTQSGEGTEGSNEQIPGFSGLGEEHQDGSIERVKYSGYPDSRLSDQNQRAASGRVTISTPSNSEDAEPDRHVFATDSRGERISNIQREGAREENSTVKVFDDLLNSASPGFIAHNDSGLIDTEGFERGFSTGKGDGQRTKNSTGSKFNGAWGDEAEIRRNSDDAGADVPRSGEILQAVADRTIEDDRGEQPEANRRTAEKTAQVINVKYFSAALDPQIVAEWTSIIEKSNAAEFLNEIVEARSREERQNVLLHLKTQAENIAGNLNLPKSEPQLEADPVKLASALTRIEIANFERASGEEINEKTFEVLVGENVRRTADAPAPEQIEQATQNFGDLQADLDLSSNLEAETLNALLDTARVGFDAQSIFRAQRFVDTNEAAAREITALVQLAYGGQADKFTDNFKSDLTEQIYYSQSPAIDIYQNFRLADWQQTLQAFAPLVNNLAEQSKLEVTPPGSNDERNKLLAGFVAQELIQAYDASQKEPVEIYIKNGITQRFMNAGSLGVDPSQKNRVADSMDENLETPEFSSSLVASAYISLKLNDYEKSEKTIQLADDIRNEFRTKAEAHGVIEEVTPVLTMK
jgi:hypothetical protein